MEILRISMSVIANLSINYSNKELNVLSETTEIVSDSLKFSSHKKQKAVCFSERIDNTFIWNNRPLY